MLAEKVSQLHRDAIVAERIASFWQKQIDLYGEGKAEEFYTVGLGLNHLQRKQFEWEGLNLSREPTDQEKLCIKGIAMAQDAGKKDVLDELSFLRAELIDQGMKAIKAIPEAELHSLVLEIPQKIVESLHVVAQNIFDKGRGLVARELSKQKSEEKQGDIDEEDNSELEDLSNLTASRVTNDVQARLIAAAQRFTLLGLTGSELWKAIRKEVEGGSTGYLDRAATGLTNKVLNFGREREMDDRADEIDRYEYSAILDPNTCSPCAMDDGETASRRDDLPDTPNPECDGADFCRCFIVAIAA